MSDKIKSFLAVLDLSEYAQREWVGQRYGTVFDIGVRRTSLADLAFSMRDEVAKKRSYHAYWLQAINIVMEDMSKIFGINYKNITNWWNCYSQPIHWIIVAKVAKELAKEE